jgi:4-amino-4-deoxy-L-arabinose transferase-like glycosyltransferase
MNNPIGRGDISKLKKHWALIIIFLILIFAFFLRVYHVDYPVVGYHNWKETHYLTESRNFAENGFFKYGFFMPSADFMFVNGSYSEINGVHTDTFPTTSVIAGSLFMLFGESLTLARLSNIFLMLGAIFFMYLFVEKLFKRKDLALVSALVMAINPLFVFFGRQVQLINPALFFMMGSLYFYTYWREKPIMKYFILFALFASLSILTKYSFALFGLPILFTFPYRRLKNKKGWKQIIVGSLFLIPIVLWWIYTKAKAAALDTLPADIHIKFFTAFTANFWNIMRSYSADNYTLIGLAFALIGLIFMFYFRKNNFGNKFMISWFIGSLIWFLVMSFKLSGHNYHQYPLAPMIIIFMAYFFVVLTSTVNSLVKNKKYIGITISILLFAVLFSHSTESSDRMFDTQFIGLDIAGEYINENSLPTERLIYPSHQSHGIVWHADRKAFSKPDGIAEIKMAEDKNSTWIFIYQWGFDIMNKPEWEYIQESYSLKQAAFTSTGNNQFSPLYILLHKGGSFSMEELNALSDNEDMKIKTYEFSKGNKEVYYFNL